jgi:AraC family transcriptional regulator, positive regulator of tynA and feaB
LPVLGSSAVAAARNATLELLMGALRPDGEAPSTTSAQPALHAAMDRYIERRLLDGSISPNALAAAHGVSIRTVNHIFNAAGDAGAPGAKAFGEGSLRGELDHGT